MPDNNSKPSNRRTWHDWMTVVLIATVLALPMYLTLTTVEIERPREPVAPTIPEFPSVNDRNEAPPGEGNPSPRGYTVSLLMWIVPAVTILFWLFRTQKERQLRRAVLFTTLLVGSLGLVLDITFGLLFFTFPNRDAIVGWCIPAIGWHVADGTAWNLIPVEEVGFYVLGALAIVLIYVWCDKYWLDRYDVKDDRSDRTQVAAGFSPRNLHWLSLVPGIAVFGLGYAYRQIHEPPGVPWYLLFLTVIGILPSMLLFNLVKNFINYRALSVTLVVTICISIFYEAVLGVPYQWWGFHPEMMTGIMIQGFSGVPVEEPLLWVCIVWSCVIFFETIYTFQHVKRGELWSAIGEGLSNYVPRKLKDLKKEKSDP